MALPASNSDVRIGAASTGSGQLFADDRERRDRQGDVGRHQQEEHEELLDREGPGKLARREGCPLGLLGDDLGSELRRECLLADRAGQEDRRHGQHDRRQQDRGHEQAIPHGLQPLSTQDRPDDGDAHQAFPSMPSAPGRTPMTSK
jgi:hypothetical protein